ncbi:MAG: PLP-dependent aminotransferase family protein [Limnochordia bacterium]
MAEKRFAKRMWHASSNAIREILKVTERPEVISFAGGLPAPSSFPVATIKKMAAEILAEDGPVVLQYGTTEGYWPLREAIAEWVKVKGIEASPEQILVLSGSQQGIDLMGKAFLDAGDRVIVEEPAYLAAIQIFRSYEAELVPVKGDEEGYDPGALERALKEHQPKLIYLVSTFHNPTGITYSLERRKKVAELAAKYDCYVIEDDPYGDLRYSGDRVQALQTFNPERVVYLGSFSKIIAPGLRIGYAVAHDPEIRQKLVIGKQGADVHTSNLSQRIVHSFLSQGLLPDHIDSICQDYKAKRDLMLAGLEEHFPAGAKWVRPDGGLFLWVTLPEGISAVDVFPRAIEENVAFVPGAPFFARGGGENTLRLNFSNASFDQLKTGCARLGKVLKEFLD